MLIHVVKGSFSTPNRYFCKTIQWTIFVRFFHLKSIDDLVKMYLKPDHDELLKFKFNNIFAFSHANLTSDVHTMILRKFTNDSFLFCSNRCLYCIHELLVFVSQKSHFCIYMILSFLKILGTNSFDLWPP
jgi:hypothetical protein